MTRADARRTAGRVRWRPDGTATVAGLRVEVTSATHAWVASVVVDGVEWLSWHGAERDARRHAVALARRLAGAR